MSVDTKKVSEAWRMTHWTNYISMENADAELFLVAKDGQDGPTPRAVSERITKIKNTAKANGDGGTPKKPASKTTTPRKRENGNATTPGSKRARKNSDDSTKVVKAELSEIVKEEEENLGVVTKQELGDVFVGRVRTPAALPLGMVSYTDDADDDADKYETTDSEYAPPGFEFGTASASITDYV